MAPRSQGQEALGRHVAELELEDSPHVQHMRKHPDLYCTTLANFLAQLHEKANESGSPRLRTEVGLPSGPAHAHQGIIGQCASRSPSF